MQHGEHHHDSHCENDDRITQRFFNFISKLLLFFLLSGEFKTAVVQLTGEFSRANHRLVQWREYVLPL